MSYQQDNYRRIREEYQTKYLRAREEAQHRREEVEARLPEVARIHRQMSALGPEIMKATLGGKDPQLVRERIAALQEQNRQLLEERARLLVAAGYPPNYTEVRYDCPRCSDTGFTDDGTMCSCMREKLICAGYESSGLGKHLREERFDNYSLDYFRQDERTYRTMSVVYRTMYDYAANFHLGDSPSGNLLLMGGTGLGKTHLSTALAKTVLDRGYDVFYASAVGLLAAFEEQRFGSHTVGGVAVSPERFLDCELLIIDDLGTEVSNQFTVSCLYHIINSRLNLKRPTVISTNLMQEELRRRYWDRITSRLFGEYQILLFLGTDIRAQKIRNGH